MKKIIILGATGTIGQNALAVVKTYPEELSIVGLHAHSQEQELITLASDFPNAKLALSHAEVNNNKITFSGSNAIANLIHESDADLVLNGIAGSPGLYASIHTLTAGKDLALANKESMVMAGEYLHALAKQKDLKIIPVDSEHSSLFYLMQTPLTVSEYIITASGGAFRGKKREELYSVNAVDAMKHPTWRMGAKISIDSASLANKGLEVIEAHQLLAIPVEVIKVIQHPQSYVHAMIRTTDGAIQAYISNTSMQLPIQNALLYPKLLPASASYLNLIDKNLSFEAIDHETFPMVQLAYKALEQKGPYLIAYNAANEIAVDLFQQGKIHFLQLSESVAYILKQPYNKLFDPLNLEHIWWADQWARALVHDYLTK